MSALSIQLPSISSIEPFRSYGFNFIIYPEWSYFDSVVSALNAEKSLFLAISPLHSEDRFEDGSIKKPHYHVVIKYKNAVWSTGVCHRTGIPHQYGIVEKTESFRGSVRYLIHFDNPEKFQYSLDECFRTDELFFRSQFEDIHLVDDKHLDNAEYLLSLEVLRDALQSFDFSNILDFEIYCYANGYGDIFRKSRWTFIEWFRNRDKVRNAESVRYKKY